MEKSLRLRATLWTYHRKFVLDIQRMALGHTEGYIFTQKEPHPAMMQGTKPAKRNKKVVESQRHTLPCFSFDLWLYF